MQSRNDKPCLLESKQRFKLGKTLNIYLAEKKIQVIFKKLRLIILQLRKKIRADHE